jgi:broad specificity phosphatase PhoE
MKIGLVRHHKVTLPYPSKPLLSKTDVVRWFDEYESATLESKTVDLCHIDWNCCYSSVSPRAVTTAREIFDGEIIALHELKELNILHLLPGRIKLPFLMWALVIRIQSMLFSKDVSAFRERIRNVVNEIIARNEGNVLIVSHWFVMKIIQAELQKNGLTGPVFKSPEHGKIYVFEREP